MAASAPPLGDLQPLFQQLVFECKLQSALFGAAHTNLTHAFHRWLLLSHNEDYGSKAPSIAAGPSRELAAFRTAREQLRQEGAAAGPRPESAQDMSDELEKMSRRMGAWKAALSHALATLDPDSAGRRLGTAPPPPATAPDVDADEACRSAVAAIVAWQAEETSLKQSLTAERARSASEQQAASAADARATKIAQRLQVVESRLHQSEDTAKARESSLRTGEEAQDALLQRVQKAEGAVAARAEQARAATNEAERLRVRISEMEDELCSASSEAAEGRKEAADAVAVRKQAASDCAEAYEARDQALRGREEANENLRAAQDTWQKREAALSTELARSRSELKAAKRSEAEAQVNTAVATAEARSLAATLEQAAKHEGQDQPGATTAEESERLRRRVAEMEAAMRSAKDEVAAVRVDLEERLRQSEHEGQLLLAQLQQRGELLAERESNLSVVETRHREAARRGILIKLEVAKQVVGNRAVKAQRRVMLGQCFRALSLAATARRVVDDRRRFRELAAAGAGATTNAGIDFPSGSLKRSMTVVD